MKKLCIANDSLIISEEEISEIVQSIRNGETSIFNQKSVDQFKNQFIKKYNYVDGCVLPNCTSAIFSSLLLAGIGMGDEVIITNLTHASAIQPLLILGVKIRIFDFKKNSYDVDIDHLNTLLTSKTKAIVVCYLHGYPFNVNEVKIFCEQKGIALIEDVAQGLGVKIKQLNSGNFGDFACFSFGENKMLRLGEGGFITSNKIGYSNEMDKIRHVGEVWSPSGDSTIVSSVTYSDIIYNGLDYKGLGFNFRIVPFAFAHATRRLNNIEVDIVSRKKKLEIYIEKLKGIEGIEFISNVDYGVEKCAPLSAWIIINPERFEINRIIVAAIKLGIPIGKFKYKNVSDVDNFREYVENHGDNFSNSKFLQANSIFLPLYSNITIEDVENISDLFIEILNLSEQNPSDKLFDNSMGEANVAYFDGFFIK